MNNGWMYEERHTARVFPKSAATVSITDSIALFRSFSVSIGMICSFDTNFSRPSDLGKIANQDFNSLPEIPAPTFANLEPHFHVAAHVRKSLAV